jgi:hypothetical protein
MPLAAEYLFKQRDEILLWALLAMERECNVVFIWSHILRNVQQVLAGVTGNCELVFCDLHGNLFVF